MLDNQQQPIDNRKSSLISDQIQVSVKMGVGFICILFMQANVI